MKIKQQYGQFYTENAEYIVGDLIQELIKSEIYNKNKGKFIDPFAGKGDLLNLIPAHLETCAYDIVPQFKGTIKQNTLLLPPSMKGSWLITNPPWLAKNKNKCHHDLEKLGNFILNDIVYDLYDTNDLYKASLKSLIISFSDFTNKYNSVYLCYKNKFKTILTEKYNKTLDETNLEYINFLNNLSALKLYQPNYKVNSVNGGIIILPLNFWCEEQQPIRNWFLNNFIVNKVKVFEEQVFVDTTYTTCAFTFYNKDLISQNPDKQNIKFEFWKGSKFDKNKNFIQGNVKPSLIKNFELNKIDNYSIGVDYINFIKENQNISNINIKRLIKGDFSKNRLVLYAQDTGTIKGMIALKKEQQPFYDETPQKTERTKAGIKIEINGIEPKLSDEQQEHICKLFNLKLNEFRQKYNSLCLTNYRNSTDTLARKRVSFDAAYAIIKYCIKELNIC